MLSKPKGPVRRDAATAVDPDPWLAESYPTLWEYLAQGKWDDGSLRVTSTLLLLAEDGVWKGCLNDRQNERALWRSAPLPEGLLQALEEALATGDADWRGNGQKGKRR